MLKRVGALTLAGLAMTVSTASFAVDRVGAVPDRQSAGLPLKIKKNASNPQHIDLNWGDSCGPDQTDFAIYEGTIGTWYSHGSKVCSTGGALIVSNVTPGAASSYYLIVPLSASVEGSYGTRSTGAEIPVGTSACRATQNPAACVPNRVFVSSVQYPANLGGLAGADQKCQTLADAAQLSGTWKAFLSDSSQNAATRLTHSGLGYQRTDGVTIATSDVTFFSTSHLSPINRDENGTSVSDFIEVWTGSGGSGVGSGGCADWTSTNGSFPAVGISGRADSAWANAYLQFCDRVCALYCVEQ
jgi:hypothetical protein